MKLGKRRSVAIRFCTTPKSLAVLLIFVLASTGYAQTNYRRDLRPVNRPENQHYLYDSNMPPGMVAHRKLLERQAMAGYFQPIKLVIPTDAKVAVFADAAFQSPGTAQPTLGMMVGHIYRLKITEIPGYAGKEMFPSIEIINRLYPPTGKELEFPVPVHIPMEDLEPAIQGRLVTRVVYLENPQTAIPEQQIPGEQPYFDVRTGDDPIRVAERLGRPMAIVRIGSRVPDAQELNGFGFGTPPIRWFDQSQFLTPQRLDEFKTENGSQMVRQVGYQEPVVQSNNQNIKNSSTTNRVSDVPLESNVPKKDLPAQGAQAFEQATQNCPTPLPARAPLVLPPAGPPVQLPPARDELIIDGGDRGLKATVTDRWDVRGMDSEDTIGHFDTLDGRRLVDESNRVVIYAPRFSAVRKIDGLGRTQFNQATNRVDDKIQTKSKRHSDFSSTTLQNLQPSRHQANRAAGGLEKMTRGLPIENTLILKRFDSTFETYENLRLIRHGFFDSKEKGRLAIVIDRARAWRTDVSAQSTTENLELVIVDDVSTAQETIHIKTESDRPKLRIVKVASTGSAHPGDIVEFTIRFDNAGARTIGNVTIMDNLTARLEYISGTAECSLPARFLTSINSVQSKTLRWEIEDPLEIGQGGVIRFQCRVR